MLADIWKEVLGAEHVSPRDSFLDHGGDWLPAVQVAARVLEAFGVELSPRAVFETPSLWHLGSQVDALCRRGCTASVALGRVSREGELPLSSAQERLWRQELLWPARPDSNVPLWIRLEGHLDVRALESALNGLVRRHEALRTRIVGGRQVIEPAAAVRLAVEEVSQRTARELAEAEAQAAFDLARGPMLRARLLRLGAEEHVLLLTVHQIAADGWSVRVLERELWDLYERQDLLEPEVQYADYAAWQRQRFRGGCELQWWRERLWEWPRVLELPFDHPRAASPSLRGRQVDVRIPGSVVDGLRNLARRSGASLHMALLAGFEVLLWQYTGQRRFLVGTVVAGRQRRELEAAVGCFASTLPLRGDVDCSASFEELVRRVRGEALEAYEHPEVPMERLQVAFGLQPRSERATPPPGLVCTPWRGAGSPVAKHDLELDLAEAAGGALAGPLTCRADLFEHRTIERMARHLERLLESAAARPHWVTFATFDAPRP